MNTGYVLGAALGEAIVPTLLMFSLSALGLQHERKARMGWARVLSLFVVAVLLCALANAIMFFSVPTLLTDSGVTAWGLVQIFVMPLLISVLTIQLLWPRQSIQPVAVAQRFLRPPFYSPARINTPLKRVGYVLFWIGAVLTVGALLAFAVMRFRPGYWGDFLYGLFVGWPSQFIDDLLGYWGRPYRIVAAIGLVVWLVGLFLSYAYDQTFGRFVRWVKTGQ
jgi:hypothetical protein